MRGCTPPRFGSCAVNFRHRSSGSLQAGDLNDEQSALAIQHSQGLKEIRLFKILNGEDAQLEQHWRHRGHAAKGVVVQGDDSQPAVLSQRASLWLDGLGCQDAADRSQQWIPVEQIHVPGQCSTASRPATRLISTAQCLAAGTEGFAPRSRRHARPTRRQA